MLDVRTTVTLDPDVEQVVRAARTAAAGPTPRRLSNIVFMGMGEPMANYDRVWEAIRRIHGDLGLSARHLTLSTVGIVPGIRYYAGPAGGRGISLFFTLYYFMTGLHALHVIAGIGLVLWVTVRVRRRTIIPERFIALELVALYWHFVDVVWVFLWPMFYLMR